LENVPSPFTNDEPWAADAPSGAAAATPDWFADFLNDRATRKPSAHTMKAYRQDFTAVADLLTSGDPAGVALIDITRDNMRAAFAGYASTHEPASIRRCWSTWNVLCDFLYTAELIPANPMPFVGRPKAAKTLPRSLPQPAVAALLDVVDRDHESTRRTDWPQRDLALILTGLLAGLRADELRRADVGDIRTGTESAAVLHVEERQQGPRRADRGRAVIGDQGLPRQSGRAPARDTQIVHRKRTFPMASERAALRWPGTGNGSPAARYSRACDGPSGA